MTDTNWQPYSPTPAPGLPEAPAPLPNYQNTMPTWNPYQTIPTLPDPNELNRTSTGGVSAVNPQAQAMDYSGLTNFTDAAYNNAMRTLQPQMTFQDERFAQDLINKGIDPYSEAGQRAMQQKTFQQNDLLSKAAYDALGFGAGIQNQMFGQDATRAGLANQLLQTQMGLGQQAREFDTASGMMANQQAYNQMLGQDALDYRDYQGAIQNMQYGDTMNLALANMQNQQWMNQNAMNMAGSDQWYDQMLGLEGLNYRDYMTSVDQQRYQDSLAMWMTGQAPAPTYSSTNPNLSLGPYAEYSQQYADWRNLWG